MNNERNEDAIDKVLAAPPLTEGDRHKDMKDRMIAVVGNRMSGNECTAALQALYPVGSGGKRKIDRNEARNLYRWAMSKDFQLHPRKVSVTHRQHNLGNLL
jgi:hypothetical protein